MRALSFQTIRANSSNSNAIAKKQDEANIEHHRINKPIYMYIYTHMRIHIEFNEKKHRSRLRICVPGQFELSYEGRVPLSWRLWARAVHPRNPLEDFEIM